MYQQVEHTKYYVQCCYYAVCFVFIIRKDANFKIKPIKGTISLMLTLIDYCANVPNKSSGEFAHDKTHVHKCFCRIY